MTVLDLLRKPITSLNPGLFTPREPNATPPTPVVVAPKPATPVYNLVSAPLPKIPTIKAPPMATPKLATPTFPKLSPAMSIVSAPLPATNKVVRKQDFKDVVNLIPVIGGFVTEQVLNPALSLKEAVTRKPAGTIKVPLPYASEERGKFAIETETSQQFYDAQIKAGVDPQKAFIDTAIKTGLDMSGLVPLVRGAGKIALLRTAPEKLVSPEVIRLERETLRDYFSGRRPSVDVPQAAKEAISEVMKSGTRQEKVKLLEGIDLINAKPSILGRFFGISEKEASSIINDLYGGPTREIPAGSLPGYRTRPGQTAPAGLSMQEIEPVGFGSEKPKKFSPDERVFGDLKEPLTNKQGQIQTEMMGLIMDSNKGLIPKEKFIKEMTRLQDELRATLPAKPMQTDEISMQKEPPGSSRITPELEPLAQEAMMYETAEEFVKAQESKSDLIGYHGTSETGAAGIERGGFFHMKDGTVYFATNPSEVKTYGTNVIKRDLSGLKLLDDNTPQATAIRKQAGVAEDSYGFANEKVREIAKKQGYDGLKTRTSKNNYDVMVFDNVKINDIYNKTKSQLTDFYNKVKGSGDSKAKKPLISSLEGPKVNLEEARKLIYKTIPDDKVNLIFENKLINEKGVEDALGIYQPVRPEMKGILKPLIKLYAEGDRTSAKTALHESGHYIFDNFLSADEKREALELARKEIGPLFKTSYKVTGYKGEDTILEEFIMDKYAAAQLEAEGYKGNPLRKIFLKIDEIIKKIIETVQGSLKRFNKFVEERGGGEKGAINFGAEFGDEIPKPAKEAIESKPKNAEEAMKSLQEYDRFQELLEGSDRWQRYQELQMQRDDLAYAMSNHPGRNLIRYVSQTTGTLPEVTGKPTRRSITGDNKIVKNSEFGLRGDDIVKNELGFKDLDEAKQALLDYQNMKGRLDVLEGALRTERPFVRERNALTRFLNSQQIKATEEIPAVSVWARDGLLKDITSVKKSLMDIYRATETVFGERYSQVKKLILDPFDDAKKAHIEEQDRLIQSLKENVVSKGIGKGTKESAAVMDLGERQISEDDVRKRFGPKTAQEIINAEKWFRMQYNKMLEEGNDIIRKIYPHSPDKLIPKRADYFRHYFEMAEGVGALKNIFETPAAISPSLIGLSEFTAPRSKWLSMAQRRLGIKTERDAVGGFLNYIKAFAYLKHIDPQIGVFRALRKDLEKGLQAPDAVRGSNLDQYLHLLFDHANRLAAKTNPFDRTFQERFPNIWKVNGRTIVRALNWFNRRTKANIIMGSSSASLAQLANIPQGIASAKSYSLPGMRRSLASTISKNMPMENSTFIRERFYDGFSQFDKGLLANSKKFAAWMTTVFDEIGTKFIWNSHYEKAIAQGIEDPIRYADAITRKLVGGRGVGEIPIAQESKIMQMIAPFQLEVQNLWWVMRDFAKEKDFRALIILFVGAWLFNRAAEETRGSKVMFDPIDAIYDGTRILQQEENVGRGIMLAGGRLAGEVLSNVYLGQTLATWIPEYGIKVGKFETPQRSELFGTEADPTRFGTGLLVKKGLEDPLFKLVTPFGGMQIKKTYQGISAWLRGGMEDKSGKELYEIDRSLPNLLRVGLFGAYSLPAAREYFRRTETPEARIIRQERDAAKEKTDTLKEDAENMYKQMKKMPKEEAAEAFKNLMAEDKDMAKKISDIAKEEARGLTYTDRQLLSAGVENGARAKAIMRLIDREDTKEAKAALWTDLVKKKVITKKVAEQLNFLIQSPQEVEGEKSGLLDKVLGVRRAEASEIEDMSADRIKAEVAFRESGTSSNPYTAVNDKNKNGTADYGKYQVNEQTLKTYSKKFLGKEVTPEEFLKSPELQEKFMENAIKHLRTLGAKSLDAFLILWHKGWGDVSTKRLQRLKVDAGVRKYLSNRRK